MPAPRPVDLPRLPAFSPEGRRLVMLVLRMTALLGLGIGLEVLVFHLAYDPFVDTRRFYDAGARLNSGLSLYTAPAGVSADAFLPYLNPPLLAIVFRPLALLPFPLAAAIWELLLVGACALTLRRIGLRGPVLMVAGFLGPAIAWALAVGQSEPLVMALLAWGSPLGVALAGQLKLVPLVVALFWVLRREWRPLARCIGWSVALAAVQVVVAPQALVEYLTLGWLQGALDWNTISPYRIHPLLWVALVLVLLGVVIVGARRSWGWAAVVTLSVLGHPRLLLYQLMTLLAGFGGQRQAPGAAPLGGAEADANAAG